MKEKIYKLVLDFYYQAQGNNITKFHLDELKEDIYKEIKEIEGTSFKEGYNKAIDDKSINLWINIILSKSSSNRSNNLIIEDTDEIVDRFIERFKNL